MDIAQINTLYNDFLEFTKNNPVFSGVIGLWGVGVLTFFLKHIPMRVFAFLRRQLTTTLVLNNHDNSYYDFLHWVSTNQMNSFVRTLHINNGSCYGGSGDATISVGFGTNIFLHNRRIFYMTRSQIEASNTINVKESISVTMIGRSHKSFISLFDTIKDARKDNSKTNILTYEDYWRTTARQFKRDMSTVVLNKEVKANVLEHIDKFIANKDWYIKNGIPYRTGILLKGPPGTGKTSFIKAICAHYDKPLYMLQLSGMNDNALSRALSSIPEGAVIALEDIDTACISRLPVPGPGKKDIDSDEEEEPNIVTLGGLLNAIDGAASSDNRIIIATTNHPEKLDPALIREGRFDIKVDVGFLEDDTFREFLNRFYPERDFSRWIVKPLIAPCKAQQIVFDNLDDSEAVLKQLAVCSKK